MPQNQHNLQNKRGRDDAGELLASRKNFDRVVN